MGSENKPDLFANHGKVENTATGNFWREFEGVISFPIDKKMEAVAIKGANFLLLKQWSAGLIRNEAKCRKWAVPAPEIADLIVNKFKKSDFKKMGINFMVVMSIPLDDCLPVICFFTGEDENLCCEKESADLIGFAHDGAFAFVRLIEPQ